MHPWVSKVTLSYPLSVGLRLSHCQGDISSWYASAEPLECGDDDLTGRIYGTSYCHRAYIFRDVFRCKPVFTKHQYRWRVSIFFSRAWEVLSSRMYQDHQSFQDALWCTLIGNVANFELAQSSFQQ